MALRPVSASFANFLSFSLVVAQPLQTRVQIAKISCNWHIMNPGLKLRLKKLDMWISHTEQGRTAEQKIPVNGAVRDALKRLGHKTSNFRRAL